MRSGSQTSYLDTICYPHTPYNFVYCSLFLNVEELSIKHNATIPNSSDEDHCEKKDKEERRAFESLCIVRAGQVLAEAHPYRIQNPR